MLKPSEYLLFWPTVAFALFLASDIMVTTKMARVNEAYVLAIDTVLNVTHHFTLLVVILCMYEMYIVIVLKQYDNHMKNRLLHLEYDCAFGA